jgi:RHS repeat-associated protein
LKTSLSTVLRPAPLVGSARARAWVVGTSVLVVSGLLPVLGLVSTPAPYQPATPAPVPAVPVAEVSAHTPSLVAPPRDARSGPAPVWPAAGVAEVELAGTTAGQPSRAGTLPVLVGPASLASGRVRVEVLDRATTAAAGIRGVVLRVGRGTGTGAAGGAVTTGGVAVTVDYQTFATAYGADWTSRLRLVSLPTCALTTPAAAECAARPLKSTNNLAARRVTATVSVSSVSTLVALTAGSSGPAGDFKATSLQPSAAWAAGGNSGAFTWSYPMRVPPAVGGPVPDIGLSYSSQSVDGRQAASNNQPSWVGEGFEASAGGSIERRYRACADDMGGSANNTAKTGDLCWDTSNATLSLSGHSGELIYNSTEDRWHLRSDDGTRVQRLTGASNGDNDGEYWVVTTTDGTQYWFGVNHLPGWTPGDPVTSSTWTVPVFGNESGEPCHATAFASSSCVQAGRWNLDYIVDINGDSASFWYSKETNRYGRNNDPNDAVAYDRGGWLDHISYGTRTDAGTDSILDATAPVQVLFGVADRCLASCTTHDAPHWPDTPWDQECSAAPCTSVLAPTFWTTKRLATVTTQVRDTSSWRDVERWTLTHTFPDPGDGTRAGLWLSRIAHSGLVGTTTTVPDVELTGIQLANRVDTTDFAAAMNWWRIAMIRNETGGTLNITYSAPDCVAGQTPTPQTNTKRCYPVRWTPEGYTDPVTDWFHKYVVTTVYEQDNTGGVPPQGSPRVVHHYDYLDGAAWHYNDDDGLIDPKNKTWSDYRGYGRVTVTTGDPGEQTHTQMRYFRGMNGDKASPTGGTKTVTIDGINDEDWYSGLTRESTAFNGPMGAVVTKQLNDPWASAATATRTVNGDTVTARFSRIATTSNRTALDAGRGERVTHTTTTFDTYGLAVAVDDAGDDAVSGDEQCTKTDYEPRNTTAWIVDHQQRVRTFAVGCAASTGTLGDADVISEVRTSYDNQAHGTAPVRGLATKTERMTAWNSGAPTFTTLGQTAYDANGRVISTWDAMGARTTTAYTPTTGGPVTATTVTNPLLHVTTTTVDPSWGLTTSIVDPNGKHVDSAYDGLGRLIGVWVPGRDKATQTASATFSYLLRNDAATAITTSGLNAAGAYVTNYVLYDGLLRPRQTQDPSPSGGRILTDTFYDSAGRTVITYGKYHANGSPGTTLVTATDATSVPNQTRTSYDGAGRTLASIFQPYASPRWQSSTYYAGDRADVSPPAGGSATSTVVDIRGRTVETRVYHGATPTPDTPGSWDTQTLSFNRKGQLTTMTDAAGNHWTYAFDIAGRKTQAADPDSGTTTFGYDNADRVTSTIDARGRKLVYQYDTLGRKRGVYENAIAGTPRAQWVYDTLAKGQLTQSTRFVGTTPYQVKVLGYTNSYKPTGTQIVIPASETGLAGTYNFFNTYNANGSLASTSLPATGGDLADETLSYGYDALGQSTTVSSLYGSTSLSYVAATTYNALGQTDQITLDTDSSAGGRVWLAYTRELETGRVTGIRVDRDTATPNTVSDLRYSFDNAGSITKVVDVVPAPVDDSQCFSYDDHRRLTAAWTPSSGDCTVAPTTAGLGGPAPYWHSWVFDVAGNRTSKTVHAAAGNTTTIYTYPAAAAARPHTLSGTTTGTLNQSYTYDAAGNTTCRPSGATANTCPNTASQALTWDPEGHLDTVTDSTGVTTFVYDADGNRLVRRSPAGKVLYLPGEEIRYTTSTGTATCVRYYTYGSTMVALRTAAGLTWLAPDHQNTTLVGIDATSQAAVLRRQDPYGNPRGTNPTWPNDRGFVGGTQDNTGLTHLGAREYDPATGRFISDDSVTDINDPQQVNGYAYADDTPVTASDATGLRPACDDEDGRVRFCTAAEAPPPPPPPSSYQRAKDQYFGPNQDPMNAFHRYQTNAKAPGNGIIVMRFFITAKDAAFGQLSGDDRDFSKDPAAKFRIAVAWDTDTGEITYTVVASCSPDGTGCEKQDPILEGGANHLDITSVSGSMDDCAYCGMGMTMEYGGLNSKLPCCSVDGTIQVGVMQSGMTINLRGDDYPSFEVIQYRKDQDARFLAQDKTNDGAGYGVKSVPGLAERNKTWNVGNPYTLMCNGYGASGAGVCLPV